MFHHNTLDNTDHFEDFKKHYTHLKFGFETLVPLNYIHILTIHKAMLIVLWSVP
jgi:hypothetical protein